MGDSGIDDLGLVPLTVSQQVQEPSFEVRFQAPPQCVMCRSDPRKDNHAFGFEIFVLSKKL